MPRSKSSTSSYDHGFECYEMIFHSHSPKIEPIVKPLIPMDAFIEERVRMLWARSVKLLEELDSCYLYH